ncbi:MAG TPA: hypothetical protein VL051_11985 [Burkholderiaceae bacterium]|nr:hypothetical protein [Burkholderiaceae bacterium]
MFLVAIWMSGKTDAALRQKLRCRRFGNVLFFTHDPGIYDAQDCTTPVRRGTGRGPASIVRLAVRSRRLCGLLSAGVVRWCFLFQLALQLLLFLFFLFEFFLPLFVLKVNSCQWVSLFGWIQGLIAMLGAQARHWQESLAASGFFSRVDDAWHAIA